MKGTACFTGSGEGCGFLGIQIDIMSLALTTVHAGRELLVRRIAGKGVDS